MEQFEHTELLLILIQQILMWEWEREVGPHTTYEEKKIWKMHDTKNYELRNKFYLTLKLKNSKTAFNLIIK